MKISQSTNVCVTKGSKLAGPSSLVIRYSYRVLLKSAI